MNDEPSTLTPEPPPQPAPRRFRVHFLVRDDAGPVQSRAGGTGFRVGTDSRWRIACDPEMVMDGELERGTGEWWCVRCQKCRETAEYLADREARPDPRTPRGVLSESEP